MGRKRSVIIIEPPIAFLPSGQSVDSEAVRQNTHAQEDAYPDVQDYADLPQRGVLLFLVWKE